MTKQIQQYQLDFNQEVKPKVETPKLLALDGILQTGSIPVLKQVEGRQDSVFSLASLQSNFPLQQSWNSLQGFGRYEYG